VIQAAAGAARLLDVLVVDDSAVVREMLRQILARERDIRVTVASDPVIALGKMRQARPDVIVLDLEMPRMDGLTFLRMVMAEDPIPVIVCSGLAQSGTEAALEALALGAIEVFAKPQLGVRDFLGESAERLVAAVRGAAAARIRPRLVGTGRTVPVFADVTPAARAHPSVTTDRVIVVGASTGGTEALRELLEALPPDAPGVVIVQHMPAGFTGAFARRLNETCRVEVKEAETGDRVREGRALIAPGNRHTEIHRTGAHYLVHVSDGAPVNLHRPSVDVLFRSAARAAGPNAVGVIMTGMGADGADGLLEMRQAGAGTVAQDEATCVVFGMPKEAIARGAVSIVVPVGAIAATMLRLAREAPAPAR
jgi:two-component system chemotaxis response regulator CheB